MALKEYVGAVVLEIDGREFEVVDITVSHDSGKKRVMTMNRKGKALGYSQGVKTWDLAMTVAIPLDSKDNIDWDTVEGAKVTIYPQSEGGRRESYLDCVSQKNSISYSLDTEARVEISMLSLDKVVE